MEIFINLLIWAFIIFGVIKKAKSSSKNTTKKESSTTYSHPSSSPSKPKSKLKKKSKSKQEDVVTQRLKRRYEPNQMPKENIFTNATNNADTFKDIPASPTPMTPPVFLEESEDLMQQVQDLIVLGYEANIPFERDFMAEGMDLISTY